MARDRLYMSAWMCVSVCVKGGDVEQPPASLTLQQGASGYCRQTHPHTHTHSHQVLALISFTHGRQYQECYPRLLWGWIQMPSDWKEEEGRNGITVSVLQKPCMCISQPLVIWGFSDTRQHFVYCVHVELKATIVLYVLSKSHDRCTDANMASFVFIPEKLTLVISPLSDLLHEMQEPSVSKQEKVHLFDI